MSFKVDRTVMQHVALLAASGGQIALKSLTQTERQVLRTMMEAIKEKKESLSLPIGAEDYSRLKSKLWQGIGANRPSPSIFLMRLVKRIENLCGRISSAALFDLVHEVYVSTSHHQNEAAFHYRMQTLVRGKAFVEDLYETKLPTSMFTAYWRQHGIRQAMDTFYSEMRKLEISLDINELAHKINRFYEMANRGDKSSDALLTEIQDSKRLHLDTIDAFLHDAKVKCAAFSPEPKLDRANQIQSERRKLEAEREKLEKWRERERSEYRTTNYRKEYGEDESIARLGTSQAISAISRDIFKLDDKILALRKNETALRAGR